MTPTDAVRVLMHLDRIQELADKLARSQKDVVEQQDLAERLHREIVTVKTAIEPIGFQGVL